MQVQFIRKSDGEPGRVEWRRFSKFEVVGVADVDFLTHNAGLFRKNRLIRYHINLSDISVRSKRHSTI
jgi:hypothetical protein